MLVSRRVSTKFSGTLIFEVRFHPESSPKKKHPPPHPSFSPLLKEMGAHAQEAVSSSGETICATKSGNNGHLIQGTSNLRGAASRNCLDLHGQIANKYSYQMVIYRNDESHREDP